MIRRASSASALVALSQLRSYVPVYAPDVPVDNMASPRMQDQLHTLWGSPLPRIPNGGAAIDFLRRCGANPTVEQLKPQQNSIYIKRAEDYYGTNLMMPSTAAHAEESLSYWTSYYAKKYGTMMRMFRRTSTSIIGSSNPSSEILSDEADMPETIWANDSYFREISFIAANLLNAHVTTMEDFEEKFRSCNPDQFLNFVKAYRYQTLTLIPLPSAACWSYEGEALAGWVKRWKLMQLEALNNFIPLLKDATAKHTWQAVAEKLAAAFAKVYVVMAEREKRQIASGITKPWKELSADERLAAGCAVIDRRYKGLQDNVYDSPDTNDSSEEWKKESAAITAIMEEDIGVGFTLQSFWSNVIRVAELEHEHLFSSHDFKVLQGRAYEQTRMDCHEGDTANFYKELLEMIQLSTFDVRNGCFIPHMSPVWCRLNWVKFGAATITHHTAAARRQLLFHHHTLRGVHALATLYYKLQPLSSSLDYSSPYRYRQSYIAACAEYGVEMKRGEHYYNQGGLKKLGMAEEAMGIVTESVKLAYGAHRRKQSRVVREREQRLLPETSPKARVAGADGNSERKWPFGSKRTVHYKYGSPHINDLQKNPRTGAEGVLFAQQTARKGAVQVTLMVKSTPELRAKHTTAGKYLSGEAAALIKQHPELKDVREDAARFCEALMGGVVPHYQKGLEEPAYINPNDQSQWEYVTTIADNLPLSADQTVEVQLPFRNIPAYNTTESTNLPSGQYCLRLRFIDTIANPSRDPTRVTEAWTDPFEVSDIATGIIEDTLKIKAGSLTEAWRAKCADPSSTVGNDNLWTVPGSQLIPLCRALRRASVDIPLDLEFQVGQVLTPKGEFYIDVLLELLYSGKYGAQRTLNEGLTDVQLELEADIRSHWRICVFVGADDEEWFAVRRHVLEDAMDAEAEWWRKDDWLESEVEDLSTIPPRQRYADQLCSLLSARSNHGGYNMMAMLGLGDNISEGLRGCDTNATIAGDGIVTSLSFDEYAVREKALTIDELLANAQSAIGRAHLRLNTLAGRKRNHFCKSKVIASYSEGHRTVFGGKYGKTAQYALGKAIEEAALTAPLLSPDSAIRDLKELDRYASKDNMDQRKKMWSERVNRHGVSDDISVLEHSSTWGV